MKSLRNVDNRVVSCYIASEIKKLIETLAKDMGISLSEYLRRLVLDDLDKRSIFTTQLKQSEANG